MFSPDLSLRLKQNLSAKEKIEKKSIIISSFSKTIFDKVHIHPIQNYP